MRKFFRLAQYFESKYQFNKIANTDPKHIFAEVKRSLIHEAFELYISEKSKDPAIGIVAGMGYKPVVLMVHSFNSLIKDIDKVDPELMINWLNKLLAEMHDISKDSFKEVFNFIDDNHTLFNRADKNARNRLKQKFSTKIKSLFNLTQKSAVKLQKILDNVTVHGGEIFSQVSPLTYTEIERFIKENPTELTYGLDSMDIWKEISENSNKDVREASSAIRALNRNLIPKNLNTFISIIESAKKRLAEKNKPTNELVFEFPEEEFQEIVNSPQELDDSKIANWLNKIKLKYGNKESL